MDGPSIAPSPNLWRLGVGVADLRKSFQEVLGVVGTCSKALLEYERTNDTEWQVLFFSGNYADGNGFVIRSDRIRPGDDVNLAARATAERFLQQKRGS